MTEELQKLNMKTCYLLGLALFSLLFSASAQSEMKVINVTEGRENNSLPKQLVKTPETGDSTIVNQLPEGELPQGQVQYFEAKRYRNQQKIERTLEMVITDIANVQFKINSVNADEQARIEAVASGWFDRAHARLQELENEKQQLQNK
jgi:hypothetical protein